MSTKIVIFPAALIAAAMTGYLAVRAGHRIAGTPEETPPQTHPAVAAANPQVLIDNFTFQPATLTITPGTKVTWINRDDVPHTATSTSKPRVFDSGTLDTDDTYSFVFSNPGQYDYFCAVHPHMTGKIIVK